jgi:hypothetical protein
LCNLNSGVYLQPLTGKAVMLEGSGSSLRGGTGVRKTGRKKNKIFLQKSLPGKKKALYICSRF